MQKHLSSLDQNTSKLYSSLEVKSNISHTHGENKVEKSELVKVFNFTSSLNNEVSEISQVVKNAVENLSRMTQQIETLSSNVSMSSEKDHSHDELFAKVSNIKFSFTKYIMQFLYIIKFLLSIVFWYKLCIFSYKI